MQITNMLTGTNARIVVNLFVLDTSYATILVINIQKQRWVVLATKKNRDDRTKGYLQRNYMQNYNKMYYMANRDEIIAESTRRNRQNEQQIKEYMKKYYASNRSKLLNYAKKKRK